MSNALIALGSNLGDRAANLNGALDRLRAHPQIEVTTVSKFYATAPVGGPTDQGEFLNAAAKLETTLAPHQLLPVLQEIEQALGRERTVHWGPRTIDLDLLLYDDKMLAAPTLHVPHPLMHTRRFVLEPAAEIAADWVHPALNRTLGELLNELPSDV